MLIKLYILYFLTNARFVYGKENKAEIDVEKNCTILETNSTNKVASYTIGNNVKNGVTLLEFYVKAAHNATVQFKKKSKTYKIVLGARNTTRCEIKTTTLINCDKDIISSEEWRGFWIEIIPSGPSIRVGKRGCESNLLHIATSNDLNNIGDFTFYGGEDGSTKWCVTQNGSKLYKEWEKNRFCGMYYNKSISPSNVHNQTVQIHVALTLIGGYTDSGEENNILELNGTANVTWTDKRLIWNQKGENYPSFLNETSSSIWKPNIILASNAPKFTNNTFTSSYLHITDKGTVSWSPSLHMKINKTPMENLPGKSITCRIQFNMNFTEATFDTLIIENPAIVSNNSFQIGIDPKFVNILRKTASQFQPPVLMDEKHSGEKFVEILKCHQFSLYNRFQAPEFASRYQTVIEMKVHFIDLNFGDEMFHLQGEAKIFWFDERFNWNPKQYQHRYVPSIENDLTWKPDISISSPITHNTTPFGPGKTVISSEGIVMWNPTLQIKTKCNIDLKNWPWDSHKCEKITIKINTPGAEFAKPRIEFPETSTWLISGSYSSDLITTRIKTSIEISLRRNFTSFQKWLFYHFVVTNLTMMCSFSISPSRSFKMVLNIVSLLLLTSFYVTLVYYIPPYASSAPNLLNDYNVLIVIGVLSNLLSIYLSLLAKKSRNGRLPKFVHSIIDNRFVRLALFLTFRKESSNYPEYQTDLHMRNLRAGAKGEGEEDTSLQNFSQNETRNSQNDERPNDWLKVALVFDRLVFVVSCAAFVRMILTDFQPSLEGFAFWLGFHGE